MGKLGSEGITGTASLMTGANGTDILNKDGRSCADPRTPPPARMACLQHCEGGSRRGSPSLAFAVQTPLPPNAFVWRAPQATPVPVRWPEALPSNCLGQDVLQPLRYVWDDIDDNDSRSIEITCKLTRQESDECTFERYSSPPPERILRPLAVPPPLKRVNRCLFPCQLLPDQTVTFSDDEDNAAQSRPPFLRRLPLHSGSSRPLPVRSEPSCLPATKVPASSLKALTKHSCLTTPWGRCVCGMNADENQPPHMHGKGSQQQPSSEDEQGCRCMEKQPLQPVAFHSGGTTQHKRRRLEPSNSNANRAFAPGWQ